MKKQLWVSSSAECAVKSTLPFALFPFALNVDFSFVCGPNPVLFQNTNSAMVLRWEKRRRRGEEKRREEEGEGMKSAQKLTLHPSNFFTFPLPPSSLFNFFGSLSKPHAAQSFWANSVGWIFYFIFAQAQIILDLETFLGCWKIY